MRRDWSLPRGAVALLLVLLGLEVVFLLGFFNIETRDALSQYGKGMVKYFVHFAFLIGGVAHIIRRGKRFHLITIGALCGGIVLNGVYGVFQLLAKVGAGVNLDKVVVGPLTQGQGGVGGINVFGQATGVQGGSFVSLGVFRVNALALDPNHLGIMLVVPIMILLPFALRRGVRDRIGLALAALIAFCIGVEILTLSRSGFLGVGVGLLVLAVPLWRKIFSPKLVIPALIAVALVGVAASQSHYVRTVIRTPRDGLRQVGAGPLPDLLARPARARRAPAARARAEHVLGLLRVPDRPHRLGPAQLLRRADRRDGADRHRRRSRSS